MKRFLTVIALVLMLALTMSVFAACADNATPTEAPTTAPTEAPAGDSATNKVTVSFWNGSKLLKEVKVDKGAKVEIWTPEQDGAEFDGWYAEASLAEKFDFEKAINEDTDIFAKFKKNEYVEDETEYYLIGGGVGDLSKASWDHQNAYENLLMEKDTSITNANVYTITITMYAGDRFQICHDLGWPGQQGIGIMVGAEYCDGINPNKGTEHTADEKKVACVKNESGEIVFLGGDENGNEFINWNSILQEGHDGVYKFTLTTYPGQASYNTLEWELVEAIQPQEKTHDMYLYGTINDWSKDDETFALTPSQDGKTWTGYITITEEMYADWTVEQNPDGVLSAAIKVVNHIGGTDYGIEGANIYLTAGTYGIKYSVEDNSVVVQELGYYLVGTFAGEDGTVANFAVKDGVTPKLENGTVTFTVKDVSGIKDFNWLAEQGKGIMAIKVVYGCELVIKDWYGNGEDNFYFTEAGSYTVTLADGVVTVAPATV